MCSMISVDGAEFKIIGDLFRCYCDILYIQSYKTRYKDTHTHMCSVSLTEFVVLPYQMCGGGVTHAVRATEFT